MKTLKVKSILFSLFAVILLMTFCAQQITAKTTTVTVTEKPCFFDTQQMEVCESPNFFVCFVKKMFRKMFRKTNMYAANNNATSAFDDTGTECTTNDAITPNSMQLSPTMIC